MVALTHYEALADYVALGAERSLTALHRKYRDEGVKNPPCLKTLANWSARHRWQAAVAEHDRIVGERLLAKAQQTAVERGFDRVTGLIRVAQQCLEDALEIRVSGDGCTASDLKALVTTAIDAIKMVETLTGGAAQRQEEHVVGMAAEALELLASIEEQKRAGLPVMLPSGVAPLR